jgi:hypothetical protein
LVVVSFSASSNERIIAVIYNPEPFQPHTKY